MGAGEVILGGGRDRGGLAKRSGGIKLRFWPWNVVSLTVKSVELLVDGIIGRLKGKGRNGSHLMLVLVIWSRLIFNLVSACGPQVGLEKAAKRELWDAFDCLLLSVHQQDKEHLISWWLAPWREELGNPEGKFKIETALAHHLVVTITLSKNSTKHLVA